MFLRSSLRAVSPLRLTLLVLLVGVATLVGLPFTRVSALRALGHAIVVSDQIEHVDVIVIAYDGGAGGELEAADLVRRGVANRVAVFAHIVLPEDLEFVRRGLQYEDTAERSIRQLTSLGVRSIERIPRGANGTQAETAALPEWCDKQGIQSIAVVTSPDHSRRLRRLLRRAMGDRPIKVFVRPTRYSHFNVDAWWRSRDGIRTGVIELQKLVVDLVRHPMS